MKKNSSVKALEHKANKGDINALFQLAEYYAQGQFVTQDVEKANLYYEKVLAAFTNPTIKLSSLKLINVRPFKEIELDFSNQPNFTVLVGVNGAGKTTLLDAIKKSLSWLIRFFISQFGNGDFIELSDINNDSDLDYSSILSLFSVSGHSYNLELSKSKEGSYTKKSGQYQEIKQLSELYRLAHSKNDLFNFPIFAFYSVDRATDINEKDTVRFDEMTSQKDGDKFSGYDRSLKGSADFKLFFRWFKHLEDISNADNRKNQDLLIRIEKLQAELNSDFVKEMEKQSHQNAETQTILKAIKQNKQDEIAQLQHQVADEALTNACQTLQSVTKAIYDFMPEFSHLRIQRSPSLYMLIDKEGVTLNILQLSQGEKSLLALVADIARRLVLLNPSLSDPLQGNGIVLIDEIDLHLHPKWQQTIIPNLLRTFPNIQFIVTTHSPQVLSTVPAFEIKILDANRVVPAQPGTDGAESSRLLKDIFGVDSRPPELARVKKLNRYRELVDNDEWDAPEAIDLRRELDQWSCGQEPELIKVDIDIRMKKFQRQL